MTQLEEFILSSEANKDSQKDYILPRWGKNHPIRLKVIDSKEHQFALSKATKWNKDGTANRDIHKFFCQVCLAGISNINFYDANFIKKADDYVLKDNAEEIKKAEDEYQANLKYWESKGSIPENKPKKREPYQRPRVTNATEALEFTLYPGEIEEVCNAVLEMSGFGVKLEEVIEQTKN